MGVQYIREVVAYIGERYFVTLAWKCCKFRLIKPAGLVATNLTGGSRFNPSGVDCKEGSQAMASLMRYEVWIMHPFLTPPYPPHFTSALHPFFVTLQSSLLLSSFLLSFFLYSSFFPFPLHSLFFFSSFLRFTHPSTLLIFFFFSSSFKKSLLSFPQSFSVTISFHFYCAPNRSCSRYRLLT